MRISAAWGHAHWYAQEAAFVGLLVFIGIVRLVIPWLRFEPGTASLALTALLVSLIPSMLWLIFFWSADRQGPEPMGYVFEVFLLGALLAQAVIRPVAQDLFGVAHWLGGDLPTRLLGSILIVGAVETFANYAAVRYTVFNTPEVASVMDGVVFGTAAGLGAATVFNLAFVLEAHGVPTTAAVLQIVITALSHASLGMLIGYFLGRAKVDQSHSHLVVGVAGTAVLNGVFNVLLNTVTQVGLAYRPWNGLLTALALAVAVSASVYLAAGREGRGSPARTAEG